jgi:Nucleotide modification associated domain 3
MNTSREAAVKVILSRKGFDSKTGKCPRPIFPDGSMCSLPIPSKHSPIRYEDIVLAGHSLGQVVPDPTRGRIERSRPAHYDPDLAASAMRREPGWRGLFGQGDDVQRVLANRGVGPGDVFLFFGLFRRVELRDGRLCFVKGAPRVHVLWGWLQIESVIDVAKSSASVPTWAQYHPHVASSRHITNNTLYVARETMVIDRVDVGVPGAGVFTSYNARLQLTKPGANTSLWSLPAWFQPVSDRPPLGFHSNKTRWKPAGERVELQSVARGQEFVLDAAYYPEVAPWLRALLLPRHTA